MNLEVMLDSLPKLGDGALLTLELVALALAIGIVLAVPFGHATRSARARPMRPST